MDEEKKIEKGFVYDEELNELRCNGDTVMLYGRISKITSIEKDEVKLVLETRNGALEYLTITLEKIEGKKKELVIRNTLGGVGLC